MRGYPVAAVAVLATCVQGYPSLLDCPRVLDVGSLIMGRAVVSSSTRGVEIRAQRGSQLAGVTVDGYEPGEVLTVHWTGPATEGDMGVFELEGGTFSGNPVTCEGRRTTQDGGSFTAPTSGTVNVVGALASGYGPVSVTAKYVLSAAAPTIANVSAAPVVTTAAPESTASPAPPTPAPGVTSAAPETNSAPTATAYPTSTVAPTLHTLTPTIELSATSTVALTTESPAVLPPGLVLLAPSGASELLRLTKTNLENRKTLAGRSYDGEAWESAPPVLLPFICPATTSQVVAGNLTLYATANTDRDSATCAVQIPAGDRYEIETIHFEAAPSAKSAAARFLMRTSFGPTRATIANFTSLLHNSSGSSWLKAQMALPATLHRAYFRQRSNPRFTSGTRFSAMGTLRAACATGSRFSRFSISGMDKAKTITAYPTTNDSLVALVVDGHFRTVMAAQAWKSTIVRDQLLPFSSMRTAFYDDFGQLSNIQDNTYHVALPQGRSIELHGWTHTRSYYYGFMAKEVTTATAVVSGLVVGDAYVYALYQVAPEMYETTSSFTVNGGPSITTITNKGPGPTHVGTATADLEGKLHFVFTPSAERVIFSGLSLDSFAFTNQTWSICSASEKVGGTVLFGSGSSCSMSLSNPAVALAPGVSLPAGRLVVNTTAPFLLPIDVSASEFPDSVDSVVLSKDTPRAHLHCDVAPPSVWEGGSPVFALCSTTGAMYASDPRLAYAENTLESPVETGDVPPRLPGQCPSAPKTFLNEHSCVVGEETCGPVNFAPARFTLNESTIRQFYIAGKMNVHYVSGLTPQSGPCTGVTSRWFKRGGSSCNDQLPAAAIDIIGDALKKVVGSGMDSTGNTVIRDVVINEPTLEPAEPFSRMRARFFDGINFAQDGSDSAHNITLPHGRSVQMTGWTYAKDGLSQEKHLGFAKNTAGTASAVVSGLVAGEKHSFSLYQFAYGDYGWIRRGVEGTNAFTVNGGNPIVTKVVACGGVVACTEANFGPTHTGVAYADAEGKLTFVFTRQSHHVAFSGISISQLQSVCTYIAPGVQVALRECDLQSAVVPFSSMREHFYDAIGRKDDIVADTFNISLPHGQSVQLTGWTRTRGYHLGFLRDIPGIASALVTNLTAGDDYSFALYQHATINGGPSSFTVNGGPSITTFTTVGSAPSHVGTATADSKGKLHFLFTRDPNATAWVLPADAYAQARTINPHLVFSGLSISAVSSGVACIDTCWEHVHTQEGGVYDFSGFAHRDPTAVAAVAAGQPNPITAFAKSGSSALVWSKSAEEWNEALLVVANQFAFLGKFGDSVDFLNLPQSLQVGSIAAAVGSESTQQRTGLETCGSPGEVANVPQMGMTYRIITPGDYGSGQKVDRDSQHYVVTRGSRSNVFYNIALKAQDQLRQRVAWALAQIFVVNDKNQGLTHDQEIYMTYHDIFVRNAFGNFRDVMKEVSYSPMMAAMLTYQGSRSMRATGFFPDENYAREAMQLFSLGQWLVNDDGTLVKDADGSNVAPYTIEDVEVLARAWTGFSRQAGRSGLEGFGETGSGGLLDPMHISNYRDAYPKRLPATYGFVGDGHPLCTDLPARPFLLKGAKYRFLGDSYTPEKQSAWQPDISGKRAMFSLSNGTGSSLFSALCNSAEPGGQCRFKAVVHLPATVPCAPETCSLQQGQRTVIDDIPGQGKTTASTAKVCQSRCNEVPACAYFSWWVSNGDCRLSSAAATAVIVATAPSLVPDARVILKTRTLASCRTHVDSTCGFPNEGSVPQWALHVESTVRNNGGVSGGDLAIQGDNGEVFPIHNVVRVAYNGFWFIINPVASSDLYDPSQLAIFNAKFPIGTTLAIISTVSTVSHWATGCAHRGNDCAGNGGNEVDTLRVVQLTDAAIRADGTRYSAYYEYVRQACVNLMFVQNPTLVTCSRSFVGHRLLPKPMCTDAKAASAQTACCASPSSTTATAAQEYSNEQVTWATANARCAAQGRTVCDFSTVDYSQRPYGYYWSTGNRSCALYVQVSSTGHVALIEDIPEMNQASSPSVANIPETDRTYSSVYGNSYSPTHGNSRSTLNSRRAWIAITNTQGEWVQFDLGSIESVVGIAVQGRADYTQYVKTYKVEANGQFVAATGGGQVFTSTSTDQQISAAYFAATVQAQTVKVYPQTWQGAIAMRADVVLEGYTFEDTSRFTWGDSPLDEKGNQFRVHWNDGGSYPRVTNASCPGDCIAYHETCVCAASVINEPVFLDPHVIPSSEQIVVQLTVGATDPVLFPAGTYVQCTSSSCEAMRPGVIVHLRNHSSPALGVDTVFQVRDGTALATPIYLKNLRSTVHVAGAQSFRNPPSFFTRGHYAIRDAEHETDALLDFYVNHGNGEPMSDS
jgi:hypothetical protein